MLEADREPALGAALLSGCAPTATVTGPKLTPTTTPAPLVVVHTTTLSLAPGQTASATATCASGEALLSGGFSSHDPLPGNTVSVVQSFPSSGTGTPPTQQGESVDSWSVLAKNPSSATIAYTVEANCLQGAPVATAVWSQPLKAGAGDDTLECPTAAKDVLTGGGYISDAGVSDTQPQYTRGWAVRWWIVANGQDVGTMYVVCASGLVQDQIVTALSPNDPGLGYRHEQDDGNGHRVVDYAAWCPTYEILSGGGFYRTLYPTGAGEPMTANWLVSGSQQEWHASYDNTGVQEGSLNDWADMWSQEYAVCVDLKAASGRVSITFSNYHHLIRIPADVIVATDGSGEVKAQTVTVRVGQAQSAPIEAVKTTNPFTGGVSYVVPAGCGDPTPANTAATAALKQALRGKVPTGQVAFGNPAVTLDSASLTCTPTAGTSRTAPFTYTQAIDGSASQSAYAPTDVLTYQLAQLTKAAVATGSQYALRDTLICPTGPQIASATATKATVTCAAYGVAEWQWSADALQALARSLAGKSQADALQLLDATPGIDAGSAVIRLSHGGTLPTDPSKIALSVGRLQDTPPVVRTP